MTAGRTREVDNRLDRVREVLDRRGLPGVLLRTRRNFAWLTAGGESHILLSSQESVAPLLVTSRDAVAITQNMEAARIEEEELAGLGIETVAVPWWESDAIGREAERRAGTHPAVDDDVEDDLVPIRSVLAPLDQDRLAQLGIVARDAVEGALAQVREGATEHELATALLGRLTGVRAPVVLAAADDRIARYRHPLPTDTPIRRRVMLVLVAERWGLHVAVTRFRELAPPAPDLARRIAAVRDIERAVHEATRAGTTLGQVFAAGQAAYAAAGFADEWRNHHQGGSIAYQGRETIATPGDRTVVEPGMAFAWNPSVPGAKVEDTFILGSDGNRRVVTAP